MKRTFFSILFICLLLNIQAQIDESRYVHLSVEEGLAARSVFDIEMDHQGFIWVGSEMGLNRYNGQRFKLYFHDENDPFSINGNFIRDIFEDSNNNLWIACHGICLYNSYYDDFINFENDENDPKTLDNNMTNGFYEDHEGYLWFGHWDGAARINTKVSDIHIEKYGPTKKLSLEFTNYILNEDASVNGYITNFFEDHQNNLWMCGRDGGLYKLDRKTDKITKIKKGVNGVQIDDQIRAAYKEGNIVWLGTWDHYFYKLTLTDSGPLVEKLQNKTDFLLYDHNQINDIDPFENENLLLSHQAGFSIFDKKETFFNYSYHPDKKHNLLSRETACCFIDHTGSFWFGTSSGGVNYLPVKLKYFNVLQNDLSNPNSIPTNFVEKIVSNGKNLIFVYLRDGGGWLWFKPYSNSVEKSPVYFINDIHIHLIDSTAVFYYKKQIVFKDVFTKKTVKIPFSIKGNIHLHAPEKELWIRTEQGYINLDNAGNIKERILHDKNNDRSVKLHKNKYTIKRVHKNYLFCILWDKGMEIVNLDTREAFISESINIKNLKALYPYDNTASLFYIVKNGQINKFYLDKDSIEIIKIPFGKITSHVQSALKTEQNIWMGTMNGLVRFNMNTEEFNHYSTYNGLPGNNFNYAAARMKDNMLCFGTNKGLVYFYPDSINHNTFKTPLVFTNFSVFGKSLKPNKEGPLHKGISLTKEITLKHNQNMITIDFQLLNYINSDRNSYKYYLEGLEEDFGYRVEMNQAKYASLKPGKYTFYVKATNSDNVWTEPISLKIHILHPFYATWWFTISVGCLVLILVFSIYKLKIRSLKRRQQELEAMVEERTEEIRAQAEQLGQSNIMLQQQKDEIEAQSEELRATMEELYNINQELKKLNLTKDKFFSIIAHDLKNPFHAISGMSSILDKSYDAIEEDKRREFIKLITNSAKSASALLENLLTWSRSQTNQIKFNPHEFNLHKIVKETFNLLEVNAKKKNIRLKSNVKESIKVYADHNMTTTVIRNLLNNALKFTPEGGMVEVLAESEKNKVNITISDNGVGMPKNTMDKLFCIDKQKSTEGTSGESGTGLGLIICKEFVEKNKGEIWVESKENEGSRFVFTLPKKEK